MYPSTHFFGEDAQPRPRRSRTLMFAFLALVAFGLLLSARHALVSAKSHDAAPGVMTSAGAGKVSTPNRTWTSSR